MRQTAQALADRINLAFKPGDKVRVKVDDGSIVIWTMKWDASTLTGNMPVIWAEEHRGCYDARRVQLVRTCSKCGCCDTDCRQCIEASGRPCYWVAQNLCSRCQAEQEAAAVS